MCSRLDKSYKNTSNVVNDQICVGFFLASELVLPRTVRCNSGQTWKLMGQMRGWGWWSLQLLCSIFAMPLTLNELVPPNQPTGRFRGHEGPDSSALYYVTGFTIHPTLARR